GERNAFDGAEIEQASEKKPQLVARSLGLGGEPPAPGQLAVLKEPERCLGVSDVDCEQSGHGKREAIPLESPGRWPSCACVAVAGARVRWPKRRRTHAAMATGATTSRSSGCRRGDPAIWRYCTRARSCASASRSA